MTRQEMNTLLAAKPQGTLRISLADGEVIQIVDADAVKPVQESVHLFGVPVKGSRRAKWMRIISLRNITHIDAISTPIA